MDIKLSSKTIYGICADDDPFSQTHWEEMREDAENG